MTKQNQIDKVVDTFLKTDMQSARFGRYVIESDKLVYRMPVTEEIRFDPTPEKMLKLACMVHSGIISLINCDLEGLQKDASENVRGWVRIRCLRENVIATRVKNAKGVYLYTGNKDALGLIGRKVSFGREKLNRYQTEIQSKLAKLVKMKSFDGHTEHGSWCKCAKE
jgi:hypothetical protein